MPGNSTTSASGNSGNGRIGIVASCGHYTVTT